MEQKSIEEINGEELQAFIINTSLYAHHYSGGRYCCSVDALVCTNFAGAWACTGARAGHLVWVGLFLWAHFAAAFDSPPFCCAVIGIFSGRSSILRFSYRSLSIAASVGSPRILVCFSA